MRSLVCTMPGTLDYQERNAPILQEGQAIVRIKRIGICGTDLHAFRGTQPFFEYPRIMGHELAADLIDADRADGFKPGDPVTVIPYLNCGHCIACRSGRPNCCARLKVLGVHMDGGMTEYLSVPASSLVASHGLSYEELALVEPLAIGAHAARRAAIRPGHFVLVLGAGPIGLAVMDFARLAGGIVIALETNPLRLEFCRKKGKAHYYLNPALGNTDESILEMTKGDGPAVVMDATGNLEAIESGFEYMSPAGSYILVGLQKEKIKVSHPEFHRREATLMSSRNALREDFELVIRALGDRTIQAEDYITHRFSFQELASEFRTILDPGSGVVKAQAGFDSQPPNE